MCLENSNPFDERANAIGVIWAVRLSRLSSNAYLFLISASEKSQYESIVELASRQLSEGRVALFKLSLALRAHSPAVETFQQVCTVSSYRKLWNTYLKQLVGIASSVALFNEAHCEWIMQMIIHKLWRATPFQVARDKGLPDCEFVLEFAGSQFTCSLDEIDRFIDEKFVYLTQKIP